MELVDADPADLLATAAAQPHDPGFVPFVRRAQAAGIPVEVVSDGFGFFIEPALERARASGSCRSSPPGPRSTAGARDDRLSRTATRRCFVCGTCKRNRVLAHQAAGRAVVFIGDGESDRYAAGYSDVVFAKRSLVRDLRRGRLAVPALDGVQRDRGVAGRRRSTRGGRPGDPAGAAGAAPFFCGPEVWGEGLVDPPRGCLAAAVPLTAQSQRSQRANSSNGHPAALQAR